MLSVSGTIPPEIVIYATRSRRTVGSCLTAGDDETTQAGDRGTATAGYRGAACAGKGGTLVLQHYNGREYLTVTG